MLHLDTSLRTLSNFERFQKTTLDVKYHSHRRNQTLIHVVPSLLWLFSEGHSDCGNISKKKYFTSDAKRTQNVR